MSIHTPRHSIVFYAAHTACHVWHYRAFYALALTWYALGVLGSTNPSTVMDKVTWVIFTTLIFARVL